MKSVPFCWLTLQGSTTGMLTGMWHADEIFHALAWSCGVPSIIPDGELREKMRMIKQKNQAIQKNMLNTRIFCCLLRYAHMEKLCANMMVV